MSTAEFTAATESSIRIPAALESSNAKLVYLYLDAVNEATVDDLQAALQMQQLTLFPTLDTLESEDLVERNGETFALAA